MGATGAGKRSGRHRRKKLTELLEWERSRSSADKLQAAGFGEILPTQPNLCPLAEQARHCWVWCGGWMPERWPLYEAIHPVANWPQVIEMMEHIRGRNSAN